MLHTQPSKSEELIKAIHNESFQKLREMIEKGHLSLTANFDDKRTALHVIVIHETLNPLLEWILKNRPEVDINARNNTQSTPLIIAADHSNFEAVKLLIAHGANPELKSKFNETARIVLARRLPKKLSLYDQAIRDYQDTQELLKIDLYNKNTSHQLPQAEKKELSSQNKSKFPSSSFSFLNFCTPNFLSNRKSKKENKQETTRLIKEKTS